MKRWLIVVISCGAIWILDGGGYFNWLKRPVSKISEPIRHYFYQLNLPQENQNETAIAEEAVLKAELNKLQQENVRLRELLGVKLPASWKFVPAKILQLKKNSLIVDIGTEDGIKVGQTVIGIRKEAINNGIVIGKIKTSQAFQAEAELVTSPEVKIKAKLDNGAEGLMIEDNGRWLVTQVLQKFSLTKGQLIMTAGGDGWPAGLALGRVGEVMKEDEAVFQKAEAEGLLTVEELSQVFIISE